MDRERDPEVDALTAEIRRLTREASALSCGIRSALEELVDFSDDIANRGERRRSRSGYEGQERRRD